MSAGKAISEGYWRSGGGRSTEQRNLTVEALASQGKPVTAKELALTVGSGKGHPSLATIYRTLKSLSDSKIADVIRRDTGELAYMLCTDIHHHHLTCRQCGRVVEVTDCRLGKWASQVASRYGFAKVEHSAELTGVCAGCR